MIITVFTETQKARSTKHKPFHAIIALAPSLQKSNETMQTHLTLSEFFKSLNFLLILVLFWSQTRPTSGFGSMGPISASLGYAGFFCAIAAAGGNQEVLCWGKNTTSPFPSSSSSASSSALSISGEIPAMFAISGGEGFLCGISSNTSQAFCWSSTGLSDLVPPEFRTTAYSAIAAGTSHVCAVRGPYYSDHNSGTVDCWDIVKTSNNALSFSHATLFNNQSVTTNMAFKTIVSGEGFTCGDTRDGGSSCWGPKSNTIRIPNTVSDSHLVMASSKQSVCAVSQISRELSCWGDTDWPVKPPKEIRFVWLSAGSRHFCGIREDNHGVECWGFYNSSTIPKGPGFKAIASSDLMTCGIREDDLVLDCWANRNNNNNSSESSMSLFDPPLELCSPGVCSSSPCGPGEFVFNASVLNEPDLTNLCARKDLNICSPCGTSCSEGFFLSSPCTPNSGRVCTPCSLCQNSSCWGVCGLAPLPSEGRRGWPHLHRAVVLVGFSLLGLFSAVVLGCLFARLVRSKSKSKSSNKNNIKSVELENEAFPDIPSSAAPCPGAAQVFRLSELKDATNGFKEFNELGRGSYGFVYKAALGDGRQVAVKRANAATIIQSNSREMEMELEMLCKIRHCNIVNLLGYCSEMGERLLVYEYMPHGTLFDHLHGGLSPLSWTLRLRISMQASKGLEHLHKDFAPPIVHRHVKTSNILLDADWSARVADFGLLSSPGDPHDLAADVFGFGVVLLEVLSGRKAYDRDLEVPRLVHWARPLINQGKAAAVVDRYVALPRNVEPLLKLADVAELATREDPAQRPTISQIAASLEQIVKDGLIL